MSFDLRKLFQNFWQEKFKYRNQLNNRKNKLAFDHIISNLDQKNQKLVYFHHEWGGGADMYLKNKIEQLKDSSYIFVVICVKKLAKFNLQVTFKNQFSSVLFDHLDEISNLFSKIRINEIYINQISSFPDIETVFNLIKQNRKNCDAKTIMLIHDFASICIKNHLIKDDGTKCDMVSNKTYCNCSPLAKENVKKWQQFLIDQTDKILCFSNNSKQIISEFYPALLDKIDIIPHDVPPLRKVKIVKTSPKINIATIGFLNKIKGCDLIKEMSKIIIDNNLPAQILVIGKSKIKSNKALKIFGKYERKDLPKIIEKNQIDIVFISSICEETFSYAAHEAMMMGLKVACFPIGAQLEYIAKYDQRLIISEINAETALDEILNFVKQAVK